MLCFFCGHPVIECDIKPELREGGGNRFFLPLDFIDFSKMTKDNTRDFRYLTEHQSDVFHQIIKKLPKIVWEKYLLVTKCSAIFGKKGKYSNADVKGRLTKGTKRCKSK